MKSIKHIICCFAALCVLVAGCGKLDGNRQTARTKGGVSLPNTFPVTTIDERLDGKPPVGTSCSVKDFDYQVKYQRALEAVIWSRPATSIFLQRLHKTG